MIGAKNEAERVENRLEWSEAVSGVQKIKWSGSGAGGGGRRKGNRYSSERDSGLPQKVSHYNMINKSR